MAKQTLFSLPTYGSKVAVSEYPPEMYNEIASGWRTPVSSMLRVYPRLGFEMFEHHPRKPATPERRNDIHPLYLHGLPVHAPERATPHEARTGSGGHEISTRLMETVGFHTVRRLVGIPSKKFGVEFVEKPGGRDVLDARF